MTVVIRFTVNTYHLAAVVVGDSIIVVASEEEWLIWAVALSLWQATAAAAATATATPTATTTSIAAS